MKNSKKLIKELDNIGKEINIYKDSDLKPTHLLINENTYESFLKLGGIKKSLTIIDFYGLKTILTKTPIEKSRILFFN